MVSENEIKAVLAQYITEAMYMEPDAIEGDMLFSDFGLESVTLFKVIERISGNYGIKVELKEFLNYQTLEESAEYLAKLVAA